MGEQPATLVITQRGMTFVETKRLVIRELEAIETREQMENGRENHVQNHANTRPREPRTQVRQVSRAHESPRSENGNPPEKRRPSSARTKKDEERCKREGTCFRCGSKEHLYVECPERKSWRVKGRVRRDSREPSPTWKNSTPPHPKGEREDDGAPDGGRSPARGGSQMYLNKKSGGPGRSTSDPTPGVPHQKGNEGARGLLRRIPWVKMSQTDSPHV